MNVWVERTGHIYALGCGVTVAVYGTKNGKDWDSVVIASSHPDIKAGDYASIDADDIRSGRPVTPPRETRRDGVRTPCTIPLSRHR
ncbi:hypothetical protein [Streptomyces sp. NBC_01304]|uniref:hypothetical protein n=1 Tax=Streptomyces sp. NBC_01304 TaxID=2903818 RepID=UPI002E136C13|nr:hypothetical protein OG430_48710 [Streptomyces sp. NBC_01304]